MVTVTVTSDAQLDSTPGPSLLASACSLTTLAQWFGCLRFRGYPYLFYGTQLELSSLSRIPFPFRKDATRTPRCPPQWFDCLLFLEPVCVLAATFRTLRVQLSVSFVALVSSYSIALCSPAHYIYQRRYFPSAASVSPDTF